MATDITLAAMNGGSTSANDIAGLDLFFETRAKQSILTGALASLADSERVVLLGRIEELAGQLDSLIHVTHRARQHGSLDTLLNDLMQRITHSFNADRSTLFLYDDETDELYSRIAQGELVNEIRFASHEGVAGAVFHSGEGAVIRNAYDDPRFNPRIDSETGYTTRSLLCVPLRTRGGDIIGVTEVLNRRTGEFTTSDKALLEAFTTHTAVALENAQLTDRARAAQREESQLMEVTQAISSELNLDRLLRKIMAVATDLLDAERSTLFLHDNRRDELWSRVAEGLQSKEIRIADDTGIAGHVFRARQIVNIRDAYSDDRFNPEVDRETGFRTRNMLSVPVIDKMGNAIGVMQVLNKSGGPFTRRDERRLELLASQSAIALDNARLFMEVLEERNYGENVLRSLTNGVITLDERNRVEKINDAALRTLKRDIRDVLGRSAEQVFASDNRWILGAIRRVNETREADTSVDAQFLRDNGESVSVNLIAAPIYDTRNTPLGSMIVMEDITTEKRIRSTMSRYMNKELADQLLEAGDAALGGRAQQATILFTDIKDFTSISERLGAQGTVALLNEYFSAMVDVVFKHNGILDKYIGDGIMAVFGTPFPTGEDADNAVRVAIDMLDTLAEFNRRRVAAQQEPIEIRVGINSDEVVAGNIGSTRRMDYTVVGDGVNLAARLESANKYFGTRILASGSTVAQLRGSYLIRELDRIRVKGKLLPAPIYEIVGRGTRNDTDRTGTFINHFERALHYYRAREWQNAIGAFAIAQSSSPDDRPCRIYIERARHYLNNPPPADWDGVWSLSTK